MKCPKCRFENPEGSNFCLKCGCKLEMQCPQCGNSLPSVAMFCNQCGYNLKKIEEVQPIDYSEPQSYTPKFLADKILTTRSSIEGERKLVTVLFADVVNYTAIAEKLDPEDVHRIIDGCFKILMDEIHKYEGTINQFTGDGVMALFGAPVAHEDHAQRSCHAALSIQKAIEDYGTEVHKDYGADFKMRIGLNSGPVIVGSIGDDLRMDYTAVGDTTNLASRIESIAGPGTTFVSRHTHRLARDYFEFKEQGKVKVKGKEEPQEVLELIKVGEVETRIAASVAKGLSRFVGRKNSMVALLGAYNKARSGSGQVVGVVGDAGVGKSRLLLEFKNQLPPDEFAYLEGQCLHFGNAMAYLPVLDILRSYFNIKEGDPESLIKKSMKEKILQLDDKLHRILPSIHELLSLEIEDATYQKLEPQQKREKTFESLRDLFVFESQNRLNIIVVEDLHWIDKTSEEFLSYLIEWLANTHILLILLYRPEYTPPWGSKSYYSQIGLSQLTSQTSAELIQAILYDCDIDPGLESLILNRSAGTPLYIEELTHSLLENGSIQREQNQCFLAIEPNDIQIPDTIQGIIAARMDRLEDNTKRAMQVASVIGRDFAFRILETITEIREELKSYLHNLQELEFIYKKSLFPELEYVFKHALTQEVAYNSLLQKRKKEIHGKIGKAIEQLYEERLEEFYEILAYHFAQGEESGSKALKYFCKAAEKAAQTFANREAIAHYDQALEMAHRLGNAVDTKTTMVIHQAKANLYFSLSNFGRSRDEGECAMVLAREAGDRVNQAAALVDMAWAVLYAKDFERTLAYARQAITVAQEADAQTVMAGGHFITGFISGATARLDQAKEEIDQALKISQKVGDARHQALSLWFSGLFESWEGKFVEASHLQSEAVRIARDHSLQVPILYCLNGYGLALTGKGDYDEALAVLSEGLSLAEKVGAEVRRLRYLNALGWLYSECGDLDRAFDFNQRSAKGARKRGDPETIANAEINLGDIFLAKNDLVLAQECLDGVYRLANDPATSDWMKWRYSMHLFSSYGELWLARGDTAKAKNNVDQCLEIATRTNSQKYLVKGWRLKGEIALLNKQSDEAENALRHALTIATAIGNPTQLWKTYLTMGRLHTKAKRQEMAEQAYGAAREIVNKIIASLQEPELRESLKSYPLIRQIFDLSAPE